MKTLVLIYFIILSYFIQAQNEIQVDYSILIDKSKVSDEKLNNLEKEMLLMYYECEKYVSYKLLSDGKECVFYNNEIMFNDIHSPIFKAIISNESSNFYINSFSNQFYQIINFNDKDYIVLLNSIKWEITNETKTIEGFECYKATTKNIIGSNNFIINAWFAPTIPFKYGPKLSFNLPGLVLEYQQGATSIVAKSIKYKIDEKLKEKLIKPEGIIVSQEDFDKIINEARGSN
jgi:GLPGLI family protein